MRLWRGCFTLRSTQDHVFITCEVVDRASGRGINPRQSDAGSALPPSTNPEEPGLLRSLLLLLAVAGSTLGCTSTGAIGARPLDSPAADSGLVGAWIVTATRARGAGKNLLTFSSDGTFFRSGDTHPVYSGGHGAWKRVGEGEFDATYIAFNFDPAGTGPAATRSASISFEGLDRTSSPPRREPPNSTCRRSRSLKVRGGSRASASKWNRSDRTVFEADLG